MTTWVNISEIPGYEDFTNYCINEHGEMRNGRGHIMKWFTNSRYIQMTVYAQGKGKIFHQHRALASLFIPNPDNKSHVDHINGNTHDNSLENLRWATRSENGMNRKSQSNSSSGYTNISMIVNHGNPNWQIQIYVNGKRIRKYFARNPDDDKVPDEVIQERDKMLAELHGDFASDRKTKWFFHFSMDECLI